MRPCGVVHVQDTIYNTKTVYTFSDVQGLMEATNHKPTNKFKDEIYFRVGDGCARWLLEEKRD